MGTRKRLPRMKTIKVLEIPPPLTQSEITALKTLAKEGPTNPYQIAKKAKKSYSLMFKAVKGLEKRKMVQFEGKEQTEKGTMANIYDLTLKGVLYVLREELRYPEIWNYNSIRKIIKKYDSLLPLVFGKWDYLDKFGFEKEVLHRLKVVTDNLKNRVFERGNPTFPGANIKEKVCWFFYFWGYYPILRVDTMPGLVPDPKVWKNVWKEDEDIRAFIIKEFKEERKELENRTNFINKVLSFLEVG